LQDVQGYQAMNLRSALVPAVNIGAQFGPMLIFGGMALSGLGRLSLLFIYIGLLLFASSLVFHLVTLPVEFDASARALKMIDKFGILQGNENQGARKVLNAAAFTYVATALSSLLQVMQYIVMIFFSNDRR
jgi:Zn-dependent membrane protease YugP